MLLIIRVRAESSECQLPSSPAASEQNANSQVTDKWADIDGAAKEKTKKPHRGLLIESLKLNFFWIDLTGAGDGQKNTV